MVRRWTKPDFDPAAQKVVKAATALVNGIWTQQWSVIELSAEEIAAIPPAYATASDAKQAMTKWIDSLTAKIQNEYPDVVQKSWADEEAMAAAYLAGTHSEEQLEILTADASAKGRTPSEHATRILEKAQTFRSIAQQTRTLWLATEKALENAADPAQYELILDAAIAQAAPLAEAYGL